MAQPIMDYWKAAPADFPNYARGSWGPTAAEDLIGKDGRRWFELLTDEVLHKIEIFKEGDPLFLSQVILALRPEVLAPGEVVMKKGDVGKAAHDIVRGQVEIIDDAGTVLGTLRDGAFFGELALLTNAPRAATVRARTSCDLMVLDKPSFDRILKDHPQFGARVAKIAKERYHLDITLPTA